MRNLPTAIARSAACLSAACLTALCLAPTTGAAQQPPAPASPHASQPSAPVVEGVDFRVYDHRGRARSIADVFEAMDETDALLVGETHDDAVGHGVEAELFMRAAERMGAVGEGRGPKRPVVLSLEMFERDVQYILDEYLAGLITEDQFKRSARPWDRYDTDYRPMVEFARAHGLPVVAANAPRRYVNRVSRLGPAALDPLPATAKAFLPPLPFPGPSEAYTAKWNALMAEMMAQAPAAAMPAAPPPAAAPQGPPRDHGMGNALQAQALWDAAMGHAVAAALDSRPGALVVHCVGSFHVESGTGIPERIRDYRPRTRTLVVFLQPAADVNAWDGEEHRDLGDFVVLTRKPPEATGGG
ncbi:MAG TPA: ChaN family lipoprotein [Longimicrobiales bacterium]|nr:ChaN family lipoprotein [Longimicrobiales bacterium]